MLLNGSTIQFGQNTALVKEGWFGRTLYDFWFEIIGQESQLEEIHDDKSIADLSINGQTVLHGVEFFATELTVARVDGDYYARLVVRGNL